MKIADSMHTAPITVTPEDMAETLAPTGMGKWSRALPRLLLAAVIGLVIGIGGYAVLYAKGSSYLTDDPAACANCHSGSGV